MWDFEAQILLPLLVEKTGINNQILKEKLRKLIKQTYGFYDKHKVYMFLINGLNSKNLKTKAECLDEIADFILANGVDYTTEKEIKIISKLADSPDKNVRENSVKVMAEVYTFLQEDVWRVMGDMSTKAKGLFEQRFKNEMKKKGGDDNLSMGLSNVNHHEEKKSRSP